MQANYKAWCVDVDDFYKQSTLDERIKFLTNFGVLAPSSHNSQPWQFNIENHVLILSPNFNRALPASDVNNRQLFISLGCALENILVAADYYGMKTQVAYKLSEPDYKIEISLSDIDASNPKSNQHLIYAIPKRHTNRNKYKDMPLPKDFVELLHSYQNDETSIYIIKEETQKQKIADVVLEALITAMDDKNFREELSHFVKHNLTSAKVGMPMSGFGIPTPMSFVAPTLLKYINVNKLSSKSDALLLKKYTPAYVIICSKTDTPQDWARVGKIYERIALQATQRNISTAAMAASIQIGNFYQNLQSELKTSFRPQFFLRIGYSNDKTSSSPRLQAENVII